MNTAETLLLQIKILVQEAYKYKKIGRNGTVLRLVADINKTLEEIVHLTKKDMEK